jgi:hypothetical protein
VVFGYRKPLTWTRRLHGRARASSPPGEQIEVRELLFFPAPKEAAER